MNSPRKRASAAGKGDQDRTGNYSKFWNNWDHIKGMGRRSKPLKRKDKVSDNPCGEVPLGEPKSCELPIPQAEEQPAPAPLPLPESLPTQPVVVQLVPRICSYCRVGKMHPIPEDRNRLMCEFCGSFENATMTA